MLSVVHHILSYYNLLICPQIALERLLGRFLLLLIHFIRLAKNRPRSSLKCNYLSVYMVNLFFTVSNTSIPFLCFSTYVNELLAFNALNVAVNCVLVTDTFMNVPLFRCLLILVFMSFVVI